MRYGSGHTWAEINREANHKNHVVVSGAESVSPAAFFSTSN